MGDLWIGLVGVVIGTALSLASSIIVNRWQLSKQARIDVWEHVLPDLTSTWTKYKMNSDRLAQKEPDVHIGRPDLGEQIRTLERKSILASRVDARIAGRLNILWAQSTVLHREAHDPKLRPEGPREPEVIAEELRAIEEELHQTLWAYYNWVEKRLRRS